MGGGVVFQLGGFIFKWGHPMGGTGFDGGGGGGFRKNHKMGGHGETVVWLMENKANDNLPDMSFTKFSKELVLLKISK